MQKRRQFHRVWRGLWYMVGLVVLAFGITMNTKTGLGISPIVSVAYAVSQVGGWNFGDMTFGLYAIFVAVQLVLHGRSDLPAEEKKKRLGLDVLQMPFSLLFTRAMNVFLLVLPDVSQSPASIRALALLSAIAATGIGAAMSVDMHLVPNAGDGIVQTPSDTLRKPLGLVKNGFDAGNIALALVLALWRQCWG